MYRARLVLKVPLLPVSFRFCPTRVRRATGEVVPNPTLPVLLTMNWVRVEEPTTNPGTLVPSPLGLMDSKPQGVDEPTPMMPLRLANTIFPLTPEPFAPGLIVILPPSPLLPAPLPPFELSLPFPVNNEINDPAAPDPPVIPTTSNIPAGVLVPIPTLPFLSTMNDVPVDEPIVNAGSPAIEFTDSFANGVLVPSPSLVFVSSQKKDGVEDAWVSR